MADDMSNPFRMPTDEEVFALRDEEQQRKAAERERVKGMHVWEKGIVQGPAAVRDYKAQRSEQAQAQAAQQSKVNLVAAATRDRRKEKENMADFIAKKREMFLVQMSLDTKRAEIRKLEERAQQREEALRKSEQMLQEDEMRFEEFLKDNAQNAEAAMKKAEAETKLKAEKVQEIKKLNAQIAQIKAEMSKFEEQLEDCRKYKAFLDKLTPPEWFEEQLLLRQQRKDARKAAKVAARQAEADEKAEAAAAAAAAAAAEAESKKKGRGRRSQADKEADEAAAAAPAVERVIIRPEDVSDDEETEEDREFPVYFRDAQQLLDIFTALEESNLFLIQNSQETEEALEELKAKFSETKTRMEAETAGLKAQIDALRGSIKLEEDKKSALQERSGHSERAGEQELTLNKLNTTVMEVYRAIFAETDNSLSTLQMLTNIEARLEELLSIIDSMPRDEVEAAEKQKEKERRQRAREQKQAQQIAAQEERIQRSIRRSQEPVVKRTGKPVMFRSQPIVRKKKTNDDDVKKIDEEDDINFYLGMH